MSADPHIRNVRFGFIFDVRFRNPHNIDVVDRDRKVGFDRIIESSAWDPVMSD